MLAPAVAAPAAAQALPQDDRSSSERGWNGSRALELIDRAIERRARWGDEGDLQDYRAQATGHIYFLYDLGRNTERHLIKADQLALDLYWQAPGRSRQLITGRREQKTLPTNIRYHLDHLTVVLDNYADRIHMGEGAEVRDVLHPAASSAPDFYDYRLADSLSLLLPEREVRVYKVEVRPRRPALPALVGAIYLDQATADIVRLEFTFTAAAYIDETVDYINVHLENAMWQGRYWLPYRQGIELRREFEVLKFPAGSIIRAELSIRGYEFNSGIPANFFRGPAIATLPRNLLDDYEFEDGLYDALDPGVALIPPSLEAIREEATRLVTDRYLQKIKPFQLAVPGASSVLRFRRAEGLYAGPGVNFGLPRGGELLLLGGYAVGAERFEIEGRLRGPLWGSARIELPVYIDQVADATPWTASSGAVATLAAGFDGEDYREPYWNSGLGLAVSWPWLGSRARVAAAYEEWEAAGLEAQKLFTDFRPVRQLDDGAVFRLELGLRRPPVAAIEAVGGIHWDVRLDAASPSLGGDFEYVLGAVSGAQYWPGLVAGFGLQLSGAAGAVGGGSIPAQRLFPAGGRGTVRGFDFHRFVGNLYASIGAELRRDIYYPFLSASLFAEAGWVEIEGASAAEAVSRWNRTGAAAGPSDGALVGAGVGVGLFFDILRLDLARGLTDDGVWELVFSVRREFWDWL
ncbi:MAG TPA: BamA/TamA family outer membrane protein [Gemmatimonadota bacterium]|nr:BamA/TamA family outer membrane protein [Gemmatimonadota bacterium]